MAKKRTRVLARLSRATPGERREASSSRPGNKVGSVSGGLMRAFRGHSARCEIPAHLRNVQVRRLAMWQKEKHQKRKEKRERREQRQKEREKLGSEVS